VPPEVGEIHPEKERGPDSIEEVAGSDALQLGAVHVDAPPDGAESRQQRQWVRLGPIEEVGVG